MLVLASSALATPCGFHPPPHARLREGRVLAGVPNEPVVRDDFGDFHTHETLHFAVKWGDAITPTDTQLQRLGDDLEATWTAQIGELGWIPPVGTEDFKLNVYLEFPAQLPSSGNGNFTVAQTLWERVVVSAKGGLGGSLDYLALLHPHKHVDYVQLPTSLLPQADLVVARVAGYDNATFGKFLQTKKHEEQYDFEEPNAFTFRVSVPFLQFPSVGGQAFLRRIRIRCW